MQNSVAAILCTVFIFACYASGANKTKPQNEVSEGPIELAKYQQQFSSAHLEPAVRDSTPGIAVIFEGTDNLHFYARPETAPAPGFELKVQAKSDAFSFEEPVFPKWRIFHDTTGTKVEVYAGRFVVFVPIKTAKIDNGCIEVTISGIACTSKICLPPFEKTLRTTIDLTQSNLWPRKTTLETPLNAGRIVKAPKYPIAFALSLAFLAGLILNIMPCVLPVIPLKVLAIFEQARQSKTRCITLGLSFCLGILLFFIALAALNIILRLGYGTVFQWGDHFRNPIFLVAMSLLMVVLALFMFGVFTLTVPSAIAAKAGKGKGHLGSVGMGFLAGLLSTPCSFAILTAAFAWAQTQKLPLATLAIMMIGAGMAAPYAIMTSMPSLLKYLPKAGRWTELFKQTMGFVLLIVAAWLVTTLPAPAKDTTLYFAVVLAFCVWMGATWVNGTSPKIRRWSIRIIAVAIAVSAGAWLLPTARASQIQWQGYDRVVIDEAAKKQMPVLIKFTADWCLTCKAVEKTIYSRRSIAQLIKRKGVIPIKADTTLPDNPATTDLKKVYSEPGVPVTILLLPQQTEPVPLRGLWIGKRLKELLQGLPDKKNPQ